MSKPDYPIVLVKNLPYNTSSAALYDLFGKYGNISQVRVPDGSSGQASLGTCIVVYNNLENAIRASQELNGVNFHGRYLVSVMYQVDASKIMQEDLVVRKAHIEELKREYKIE
ncbi:uncharacterized protein CANTADRAFT_19151 [Suhomyces tanzawaensis NRRL Y-17324]|uniref:RRM domain-containing protein n=1 Tax=Suhomyces tanzawaensis NRRL Y-17324 TaxID=984487 RepID=A0A1E4SPU7_9ASCO|nr:uncharacterized protein CANTADRAFT_19151 [Suhomyces tanzawaensis NRRL Y-17324]ODV81518.1 hypothetical protein CANTADRAFT_19151 [Suhomyces tanzawaensis NRRL Y-17324]